MFTPRLSLAHTGSDSFVATLIDSPKGVKTSRGRRTRRPMRVITAFAMFFTFLTILVGSFTYSQKTTSGNWFSTAIKNVWCSTPAYFNEPQAWSNGLTSLGVGLTSGSIVNATGDNPVNSANNSLSSLSDGDSTFLDTRHTAYEKYGMSGTTWTVYNGEEGFGEHGSREYVGRPPITDGDPTDLRREAYDGECVPVMGLIGTYFANSIFSFTKFFTSVSGWMLTQAYDPSWLTSLNEKTADVITGTNGNPGLRDTLYFPFLNLVIIFAALYLFWIGVVKRKSTEAMSSAAWMFGTVLVGSLFVYNPALLPDMTNQVISEVSSSVLVGTAGVTTNGGSTENICYKPAASGNASTEAKRDAIVAGANCNFWRVFVYEPWVTGQFGVSSSTLDGNTGAAGNVTTEAPAVNLGGGTTVNNWGLYQLEQQSIDIYALSQGNDAVTAKRAAWYRVADSVAAPTGNHSLYGAWAGDDSNSRVLVALASLVAAIAGMVIVIALSMSMLAYSIGTSILTFMAVFFLLIGAHPGMGRRMALRWAELYVGTIFKRLVSTVLLSMVLAFYGALLTDASDNWGTTVIAIIALSVAVMMYKKELFNAVTPSFGGSGFSSAPMEKAGSVLKGVAGGAILGGAAGAAAGFKGGATVLNASKGGALSRVASATAAGSRATAVGAGKGAVAGARRAGGGSNAAALMAGSAGKHAADRVVSKAVSRSTQVQSPAQPETPQEDNPAAYAREQREAERAQEKYTQDWERHHADPAWTARFQNTYGFAAPNPYENTFSGYGKPKASLTNPDLLPRPIRPETATETAPEAPASSQQAGAVNSTPVVAPSRMSVPTQHGAPVMPTRPTKPQARTGGGAPRPRP